MSRIKDYIKKQTILSVLQSISLLIGIFLMIDAIIFVPFVEWRWGYTSFQWNLAGMFTLCSLVFGLNRLDKLRRQYGKNKRR